jgi:hypothetical protein
MIFTLLNTLIPLKLPFKQHNIIVHNEQKNH